MARRHRWQVAAMLLTSERAERWLDAVATNLVTEYPNAPQLLLHGPDDLAQPHQLHPAFYGSFDWHSAVHMHWSAARLVRRHPELAAAAAVQQVLATHISSRHLAAEADYLRAHPTFERPYGWGWVLALHAELVRWSAGSEPGADAAGKMAAAMDPLVDAITELLPDYLSRTAFPNRAGTHQNTAFALLLALDHARTLGDAELERRLGSHALRLLRADVAAPVAYEPSAEDFLSPALTQAHLLGQVLGDADEFSVWLDAFLPGIAEVIPPTLREPPVVLDPSDWRLVHLHGLTLSRAWSWRGIARALPPRDERRTAALDAADRHLSSGLEHVVTGGYGGDHWLVSFALLALDP